MIVDPIFAPTNLPRRARHAVARVRRRLDHFSAQAQERLPQLNDVLAIYALGLAIVDFVVYWRGQASH